MFSNTILPDTFSQGYFKKKDDFSKKFIFKVNNILTNWFGIERPENVLNSKKESRS